MIGTGVEQDPGGHPDEPAIAIGLVPVVHAGAVPLHVGGEALGPVEHDSHGTPGAERQHRQVGLHREVLPGAERAAETGWVDPDGLLG